ncbi:MAG: hypothetical protein OXG35_26470, partial [Acidobacteria bacterium]|nr:hypothetical protein [Acidobacteriota bacterium]
MSTLNGATANALVPDDLTDVGGGAVFNDARVQVSRVVTATLQLDHAKQPPAGALPDAPVH